MDLNYELSRGSLSSKYLPAGKKFPWIQRKIYTLRAPGSPWPGEKKARLKGKTLKSTRNLLKTRNHRKIEALKSPWLALLNKVKANPLT